MVLIRILILFVLLLSNQSTIQMDNNILEVMSNANEIVIYQDNTSTTLTPNEEGFKTIANELMRLSASSRECPAFGVSLHNETIEAMSSGLWLECKFNQTSTHNEMPFDTLLIQVVGEYTGFNIIRKYDNKYEGRCFYVDLIDLDLSTLENLIEFIV